MAGIGLRTGGSNVAFGAAHANSKSADTATAPTRTAHLALDAFILKMPASSRQRLPCRRRRRAELDACGFLRRADIDAAVAHHRRRPAFALDGFEAAEFGVGVGTGLDANEFAAVGEREDDAAGGE